MVDYNICKDINEFYFKSYTSLDLIPPKAFPEFSPEFNTTQAIQKYMDHGVFDKAAKLAELSQQQFPQHQAIFMEWQVYALWKGGLLPSTEVINFYAQLESLLPKEAHPLFNKAALYARDKNFSAAVEELNKARKKDNSHARTISLLFWIYYFSGDEQWKYLLTLLKKNNGLPEQIANLIARIESVDDRKETPLYAFADKENLFGANETLFQKFPDLSLIKAPTQKHIFWTAVDGNYLREYVTTFVLSLVDKPLPNVGIHVHVYHPLGTDIDLLRLLDETFPHANLSYSIEGMSYTLSLQNGAYYASMRYARAYQVLMAHPSVEKIAIVDADVIVRQNPFARKEIIESDVTLTGVDVAPKWERFAAGFSCFSQTELSKAAFAYMTNILLKNFATGKEFWFIDQVALSDMERNFLNHKNVYAMPLNDIFGVKMQHTAEALLWTYTNEHKLADNPMNQERQRLVEKYPVTQEWNGMAKGKYGYILANKNDEYIGRSLLTHGSWCDHEISYMRGILTYGDTVLELGSNMGSHTMPLAKIVGQAGRVYAVEPQRLPFQTVCANVAMNSLGNVYTLHAACGAEEGFLDIGELDPTQFQNFGGFRPKENAGNNRVRVITVDSLHLDACRLIKLDIEGMELEALKGSADTLNRLHPVLFFEAHGDAVHGIAAYLKDFGYTVYDFAIPNDPMYLAVTEKDSGLPTKFGIKALL